jgi:hypothetical protein
MTAWPTPGSITRRAPGISVATWAETSGGVRRSSCPCSISVGTAGYGPPAAGGGRPGSGQRRQRSISSAYATSASNGANAEPGSASARSRATRKRSAGGVPRGHGSGVSSHTVA